MAGHTSLWGQYLLQPCPKLWRSLGIYTCFATVLWNNSLKRKLDCQYYSLVVVPFFVSVRIDVSRNSVAMTYNLLSAGAVFFIAVLHQTGLIQMCNFAVRTLERVAIRSIATDNKKNQTHSSLSSAIITIDRALIESLKVNHLRQFISRYWKRASAGEARG